jgi:hypothetical protein
MGREQAYHLIENGMKRLRTRGDATLRTADSERPNTFLALDGGRPPETASSDERLADSDDK